MLTKGMKQQVTGYLGELAVERFFLERNMNCRRVSFSLFDLVVDDDSTLYRLQVKTSRRGSWSVLGGRNRRKKYDSSSIDGIALVQLNNVGDYFAFIPINEVTQTQYSLSTMPSKYLGETGWSLFKGSN